MSENKEVTIGPIEEWGSFNDDSKADIDQMMANSGISMYKAKEIIRFTNPEKDRINKVTLALTYALGSVMLEKNKITNTVESENCGTLTVTHEGDDFSVIFIKYDNASEDQYKRSRNLMLEKTNELLETFDNKTLPVFTLKDRKVW